MARVYNFSAGPAVLPEEVLKEAAAEMLDYKGSGQSVMEMSHRSKVYDNIIKEAEADLRDLLNIPDNYKVLFLQGGASQFFAEVPMNLMKNKKAAYIITGQWAKKAYQEAKIYGDAIAVASSEDKTYSYIPDCSDLDIPEDADFLNVRRVLINSSSHVLRVHIKHLFSGFLRVLLTPCKIYKGDIVIWSGCSSIIVNCNAVNGCIVVVADVAAQVGLNVILVSENSISSGFC